VGKGRGKVGNTEYLEGLEQVPGKKNEEALPKGLRPECGGTRGDRGRWCESNGGRTLSDWSRSGKVEYLGGDQPGLKVGV